MPRVCEPRTWSDTQWVLNLYQLHEGVRAVWGPVHPQGHKLCDPPDVLAHLADTQPRLHPQKHSPGTWDIILSTHLCTLQTHTYPQRCAHRRRTPTST